MADNKNVEAESMDDGFGPAPTIGGSTAATGNAAQPFAAPEVATPLWGTRAVNGFASSLSDAGIQFRERMENAFNKDGFKFQPLASAKDSFMISWGAYAVGVILHESNMQSDGYSTCRLNESVATEMRRLQKDCIILQIVVVTPNDYSRVEKFNSFYKTMFRCTAERITVDSFADCEFEISTDQSTYENAVNDLNPHKVMLRHDLCVTVKVKKKTYDNRALNSNAKWRETAAPSMVLCAIGGHVEFVAGSVTKAPKQGNIPVPGIPPVTTTGFYPVIHIDEISSAFLREEIIIVAIAIALQQFIGVNADEQRWKTIYNQMQPNVFGMPKQLNMLFPHPTQAGQRLPQFTKAEDQMQFEYYRFANAFVVLDINDGRAMIPGLVNLDSDPAQPQTQQLAMQHMVDGVNSFFAKYGCIYGGQITGWEKTASKMRGVFNRGGVEIDTAHIDYLNEVMKNKSNGDMLTRCEPLQYRISDFDYAAKVEKSLEDDIQYLYRTESITVDVGLLNVVMNHLRCIGFDNRGIDSKYMTNDQLSRMSAAYSQQGNVSTCSTPGGYCIGGYNDIYI